MPAAILPAPAAETVSPPAGTGGPGASPLLAGEGQGVRSVPQEGQGEGSSHGERSSRPGPHTPEGRAAVSLNALSHGLRSERPVLPGESQEEWDAFLAATLESLAPRGPFQLAVAERAALAFWRLQRVTRYETAQAVAAWERAPEDAAAAAGLGEKGYASRDDLLAALERSRAHAATVARVAALADAERLPKEDALAVLRAAADRCENLPSNAMDVPLGTVLSRKARGAGYSAGPDPTLPCALVEKWTAKDVRAVLASLAAHRVFGDGYGGGSDGPLPLRDPARPGWDRGAADRFLRELTAAADETAAAQQALLDRLDSETQRLREERALFPPEDVLARVQRYEAHLSRQYHAAVRELRALQSLRPATAPPPKTAEQSPPSPVSQPRPVPAPAPESAEQSPPNPNPNRAFYLAHRSDIDARAAGRYAVIAGGRLYCFDSTLRDAHTSAQHDPDALIFLNGKEIDRSPTPK